MMNWLKSEEKEMLRSDIIMGVVLDDMTPEIVYYMHDGAYKIFEFHKFKTNLRNLRIAIKKKQAEAQEDEVALVNTLEHRNRIMGGVENLPYPRWSDSSALKLLLQDLASGVLENMKPAAVWMSRPEYRVYPLSVFRDHIYKEKTKPFVKAYWAHQRELKKAKKRGRARRG